MGMKKNIPFYRSKSNIQSKIYISLAIFVMWLFFSIPLCHLHRCFFIMYLSIAIKTKGRTILLYFPLWEILSFVSFNFATEIYFIVKLPHTLYKWFFSHSKHPPFILIYYKSSFFDFLQFSIFSSSFGKKKFFPSFRVCFLCVCVFYVFVLKNSDFHPRHHDDHDDDGNSIYKQQQNRRKMEKKMGNVWRTFFFHLDFILFFIFLLFFPTVLYEYISYVYENSHTFTK